jgi:hypothetical protein
MAFSILPFFRFRQSRLPWAAFACAAFCAVPLKAEPALLFEPRVSIASDFQVGARVGLAGLPGGSGPYDFFLDLDGRLFPHTVNERVSSTFSYQFREMRWGIGGGVVRAWPLGDGGVLNVWQFVTGAGLGYSFADYRGTARAAESGLMGWGEAGLRYSVGKTYWGAGLQVKPLPSVFPVRLMFQLGNRF